MKLLIFFNWSQMVIICDACAKFIVRKVHKSESKLFPPYLVIINPPELQKTFQNILILDN